MPAPETKVATSTRPAPSRLPIEGPSAWVGVDMRGREAEWTYRLSPPEIVEIETAVKAVQARGLDIADIRRDSVRCWTGCASKCSTAEVLCCCAACPLKIGRWPRARWRIGASAPISATPALRTRKGICWACIRPR